jgi:hypothetical protein
VFKETAVSASEEVMCNVVIVNICLITGHDCSGIKVTGDTR